MNKRCTYCKTEKALDLFPTYRPNKDGRASCCKDCFKARYGRKYDERRKSEAFKNENRIRQKKLRALGSETTKSRDKRCAQSAIKRHPDKYAARQAISRAVARGEVQRVTTCEVCGVVNPRAADGRSLVQAHHDDYSKPMVVRWLCITCHTVYHRAMKDEIK